MIADLKPYPEYKRTEIEWLDGLPSHWHELSLKRVARSENSGCYGNEPENGAKVLAVATTAQIDRDGNFAVSRMPQRGFTEEEVARYCCKAGDILVVKSSGSAANVISGKAGIVRADTPPFVFSNFLMRFVARAAHVEPEFLFLMLTCNLTRERVKRMVSTTTYPNLRVGEYCSALLPVPPPAEQAAIVRFLDWANGRLERAIRAKRKVIALLNEQKQAIIHRAVTRGLDPSVPLKPSGIPWLGEIPRHWEAWRISRCARVGNGSTPSRGKPAYWNNGTYPWLNSSQVNRGFIDSADQFVTPTALRECHLPRVPAGSVLVAITGQGKTRGTAALLGVEATINQHIAFTTPRTNVVSPEFLHLAFVSAYQTLRALSEDSGSTKGALTCEDLKRFKVVLPPLPEQTVLVDHIRVETQTLNSAISRLEREIVLLREYRTRLVTDIVTGKLDVREAAALLPEEAAPEAIADDTDLTNETEPADEEAAI